MIFDYLYDLISHFNGKDPNRYKSMIDKALEHEYISKEEHKQLLGWIKAKYYEYKRNQPQ